MKLALFHNSFGGGVTRVIHEFAKRLLIRKHTLDMYVPAQCQAKYESLKEYGVRILPYEIPLSSAPANIRPFFLNAWINAWNHFQTAKAYNKTNQLLAYKIDSQNYDLVWVEKCGFASSPFILRHLKTRTVYYCQEPWRDGYEGPTYQTRSSSARGIKGFTQFLSHLGHRSRIAFHRKMDRFNAISASVVLANSLYSQRYIYDAYGIDARLSYLGADTELFRPLNLDREHAVLSVGRLETRKRHELVVQALGKIEKDKRPSLYIVAEFDNEERRKRMEDLAKNCGVTIRFFFSVSDEDLLLIYNRVKAVAYTAMREPFGLVAIEAMACGTPVVGVREGGLQETILHGETGFLAKPEPEACAEAIKFLLENDVERKVMGEKAIEHSRHFWSWESAADRFEENLYAALGKKQEFFQNQ
jgi:glycosyltransferase involved in cell wall biosynthesis